MCFGPTLFRFFCARTFTTALAIAFLLATLCQSQAADPEPKRVLMLHSFGVSSHGTFTQKPSALK